MNLIHSMQVSTPMMQMPSSDAERVLAAVRSREARVLAVGTIVDRSGGTVDLGVPHRSLLELEVPTWSPESCPLCADGSKPEKPGSRASR